MSFPRHVMWRGAVDYFVIEVYQSLFVKIVQWFHAFLFLLM